VKTQQQTPGPKLKLDLSRLNRMPALGEYTDFRTYLHDYYQYKRRESQDALRPYTYAHFSAAANIKSPNYLKLIIEGQRNLSKDMIKKFSKALGHSREEFDEFEALVLYGQAKTPVERNQFLKSLSDLRVRQQLKKGQIRQEAFDKVPSWVSWVLFALVDQAGAEFDVDKLRDLMRNKASQDEIKKSLERLLESGELVRDEAGEVKKGRLLMSGADDIPGELVRKLQAELIYLGLESLFQDRPQDREFGALTLALTEPEYEQLKFELRQLRKRWFRDFGVARQNAKGDRVFQLNFQLFPVTKMSK
jgi:uncharacterized protein (TIGR02147 family)